MLDLLELRTGDVLVIERTHSPLPFIVTHEQDALIIVCSVKRDVSLATLSSKKQHYRSNFVISGWWERTMCEICVFKDGSWVMNRGSRTLRFGNSSEIRTLVGHSENKTDGK